MIDGYILLDKPVGVSSFQALYPVKRSLGSRKIGHAGTLDPAASGLLLCGIGAGTRLLEFLEGLPKRYRFEVRLGIVTDTYDLEGEVLEKHPFENVSREMVEALLPRFQGEVTQTPPDYSAIKIRGKRACDRVRAGETVELQPRKVRIASLEIKSFAPGLITLEMDCSKGTFVRALAHDLGQLLGCGAVADHIRRLRIGPFRVEDGVAPDAALPEHVLPLESAVSHLLALQLKPSFVGALLHGNAVPAAGYLPMPGSVPGGIAADTLQTLCSVFSPAGKLLAVGTLNPLGQLHPRKVLAASW